VNKDRPEGEKKKNESDGKTRGPPSAKNERPGVGKTRKQSQKTHSQTQGDGANREKRGAQTAKQRGNAGVLRKRGPTITDYHTNDEGNQ